MTRWTVAKYRDKWSVFDRGVRCDDFDTLEEAHTWATCNAVADVLYAPGGLTCLRRLQRRSNLIETIPSLRVNQP